MFHLQKEGSIEKSYELMVQTIKMMLEDEKDIIANFSNISSVINLYVDKLNWVGFYILKENELVLGPFQGMPACIRIKVGKGICGKAVADRNVVIVENVHAFPGHIACDSATNSEMVLPIFQNEEVFGVLDLDSPEINRFTDLEKQYLIEVGNLITVFLSKQSYKAPFHN